VHGTTIGVVQLLAAAGAGAVFALVTAPLVVYARGVVVLMITLALGELASIAAGRLKSLTGGTDGLVAFTRIRPLPGLVELDTDQSVYLYVLAVTAVTVAVVMLVLRSRFGTLLRASRDNESRMRASGHRVTWYLTLVYVFAGALAGVAGSLLVAVDQYVSPDDSGFSLSALVLLAVVIGGATSMTGAFFGAALVVVTRDWLAGAGQAPLVLGAVFVVCVYVLPHGLFAPSTAAVFTRGRFSKALFRAGRDAA
jgi:branched-chain amino acid transport system permease protein